MHESFFAWNSVKTEVFRALCKKVLFQAHFSVTENGHSTWICDVIYFITSGYKDLSYAERDF